jgi:transposase
VLKDFSEQWTQEGVFVMDAAFYTQSNLQQVGSLGWLSRVPLTLKVAQVLVRSEVSQSLEDQNQTVCDQRKQPTAKPTFRWIMQKFQGIHWINLEGQHQISNLSDER